MSKCICGSTEEYKIGTVSRIIKSREILIHNMPHYYCDKCDEISFNLSHEPTGAVVEAYRKGWNEVDYLDYIEDKLLAEEYGEDVIKVEKGESESYEFKTAEDLFKLIK